MKGVFIPLCNAYLSSQKLSLPWQSFYLSYQVWGVRQEDSSTPLALLLLSYSNCKCNCSWNDSMHRQQDNNWRLRAMQLDAPIRSMLTPLWHNLQQQPTHLTQKTVSRLSRIPSFFSQGNLFCLFTCIYLLPFLFALVLVETYSSMKLKC